MKFLLILILFANCSAGSQCSFSCVHKYFSKEKLVNFIVVASFDAKSDESYMNSFFKSMDMKFNWSIAVVSNMRKAIDFRISESVKNVVLFVSSSADIGPEYANVDLTNTRIFLIVANVYPTLNNIRSMCRKFGSSITEVVVMAKMGENIWKFCKYVNDRCSVQKKFLEVVGECENDAVSTNIRYLSSNLHKERNSCPLIVATNQFEPFTYYDEDKGFYSGIDYLIVKSISARLQQDVKFIRIGNDSAADSRTIE